MSSIACRSFLALVGLVSLAFMSPSSLLAQSDEPQPILIQGN